MTMSLSLALASLASDTSRWIRSTKLRRQSQPRYWLLCVPRNSIRHRVGSIYWHPLCEQLQTHAPFLQICGVEGFWKNTVPIARSRTRIRRINGFVTASVPSALEILDGDLHSHEQPGQITVRATLTRILVTDGHWFAAFRFDVVAAFLHLFCLQCTFPATNRDIRLDE